MKNSMSLYNLQEFNKQMKLYHLFLLNNDTKTIIDNNVLE